MTQSSFPYTTVPSRLKAFLVQIAKMGTPTKITTRSLPEIGFKSTNDRSIVGVLKSLNIISETGVPTSRWQSLRHSGEFATTLAECIRIAYPALYETFPDAEKKSEAEITNFMRHRSRAGERAVQAMVGTFRILCSMADFAGAPSNTKSSEKASPSTQGSTNIASVSERDAAHAMAPVRAEVTINLSIQLSDNTDAEQIDAIFDSLARHILWREKDEVLPKEDNFDDLEEESPEEPEGENE